ncbi:MAG: hypothetical protein IPL18_11980 [Sphingomonadales bacterium]|nr:hypothetical protein [Sphingomonadales bacterium]
MAAAMTVFLLIMLHRTLPRNITLLLGALALWATLIATSRTATGVLAVFLAYFFVIAYITPAWRSVAAHRTLATASFALVLVPILSVGLLQTVDLGEFSNALRSFQERVEISWQYPFSFIYGRWPEALFFGCGVGCFTAPMKYTQLSIFLKPVDNFYVLSLIMYGWSFFIIIGAMLLSTRMSVDRVKLVLITALNMYSVTVESYSPSIFTLLIGYATSDVFCQGARGYLAARKKKRALSPQLPREPVFAMRSPAG